MKLGYALAAALLLGACVTMEDGKDTIIPTGTLDISKSWSFSFEGIAAAGLLYLIIDPLAPNWRIEQSQIDADRYHIAMRKKRFTTGGDGEATQVFLRRAGQLARESGAASYRIIEYTEGVESSVPVAQRVAQGVVEVIR